MICKVVKGKAASDLAWICNEKLVLQLFFVGVWGTMWILNQQNLQQSCMNVNSLSEKWKEISFFCSVVNWPNAALVKNVQLANQQSSCNSSCHHSLQFACWPLHSSAKTSMAAADISCRLGMCMQLVNSEPMAPAEIATLEMPACREH
jgi:hypothetical protein